MNTYTFDVPKFAGDYGSHFYTQYCIFVNEKRYWWPRFVYSVPAKPEAGWVSWAGMPKRRASHLMGTSPQHDEAVVRGGQLDGEIFIFVK